MDLKAVMPVVKAVLTNPYVIGTTIVIILYMNFCSFVANYRKKPPKPKKAKNAPAPKPAKTSDDKSEEKNEKEGEPASS